MIERADDLRNVALTLSRLRDPAGILSIMVGVDPGAVSGRTPAPEIVLENDLTRLRRDKAVRILLERRLEAASAHLEEVLDPTVSGRGRALYIALDSGAMTELHLETALPTGACHGPAAHVLPLLAALDAGEKSGLVAASRDSISLSELELGRARHLDPIELEPWIGDWWPEMKGPARANPLRGQQTVSQRDRHERRLAAAYRRSLDSAAKVIGGLADKRRWRRAVVAGDPRRIDLLDAVLRRRGLATATIDANLEGLRPESARRRMEEALASLVARQRARLVEDIVAAGNGVCGLVPVLAVLAEGRIDHLVVDADRAYPGAVGPDESLAAAAPGEDATDLVDLIVAHALRTDATVTPVSGDAADAMAAFDGIAARLRW